MVTTDSKHNLVKMGGSLPFFGNNDGSPGLDVDSRDGRGSGQPFGRCPAAQMRRSRPSAARFPTWKSTSKTQLLIRSSRRISLTDAGRSYVAACKRILEEVGEAERIAAGEYTAPKGELNVTAPIVFGRLHLVPVLADFLQAYPDIDVRLTLSNRQVNLTEEGIDAALRVGDLPDSALIATRVGTIRRVFAASPGYLKARGMPQKPADLVGHDCIGVQGFTGSDFWSVADDGEIPVRYRLIVNSTDAACEAAKEGMGIVSVFSHHVASDFQGRHPGLGIAGLQARDASAQPGSRSGRISAVEAPRLSGLRHAALKGAVACRGLTDPGGRKICQSWRLTGSGRLGARILVRMARCPKNTGMTFSMTLGLPVNRRSRQISSLSSVIAAST